MVTSDHSDNRSKPDFKFHVHVDHIIVISSNKEYCNSKKPLRKGMSFILLMWLHNIVDCEYISRDTIGLSPLFKIKRPWRLNMHSYTPFSFLYSSWEIFMHVLPLIEGFGKSRGSIQHMCWSEPMQRLTKICNNLPSREICTWSVAWMHLHVIGGSWPHLSLVFF